MSAQLDEFYRPAFRQTLRLCPEDRPLRYQLDILQEAERRAKRAGLVLPAITWRWVDGGRDRSLIRASMYPGVDGPAVTIYIRTDLLPEDLAATVAHELQHAHDHKGIRARDLTEERYDERADAFAAHLMKKWPWFR